MDTLRYSAYELAEAGVPNAALEAEVLLCEVLGKGRAELFASPNDVLDDRTEKNFLEKISQRKEGMPLSYLAGKAYFRYLGLEIRPGVFIPRPETELLVEAIIKELEVRRKKQEERQNPINKRQATGDGPRILDIGCGSGAIALSLAQEIPDAEVTAVDISSAALEIAAENASKHALQSRVKLIRSDLFENLSLNGHYHGHFDVIVSNPPYIKSEEIAGLQREVRDFEPLEALDGGPDGLDIYRRILSGAHLFLKKNGLIAFEVGFGQAEAVSELINLTGHYEEVKIIPDYAGIDRIVMAEKSRDD